MQTGKITDQIKTDLAVLPKSLATTNETGAYFSLSGFGRACFRFAAAAMAAGKTVVGQVLKATDGLGTGSTNLTSATATITANAGVKKALLTANTIADEDTVVTINGVLFSAEATNPDIDAGEYDPTGGDAAAVITLAAAINHLLADASPKIKATASGTTVILELREPGSGAITITGAHSTIVPSTLEAEAYIEIGPEDLGDGYTHAALKLTTDATIVVSAMVERAPGRHSPVHYVAGSTEL